MADGIDDVAKRVQTVEGKVDKVTTSLDALTGVVAELTRKVNQGFAQVTAALVEQRQYTEFAHKELGEKMDVGFTRVSARFDEVTGAIVEQRQYTEFAHKQLGEKMDAGFNRVDGQLAQFGRQFEQVDKRFEQVDKRFEQVDKRFDRVEHKLDRLIAHLPPTSGDGVTGA